MNVVPGRPTMVQWKTIHLRTFEQHKLDLMGFIFLKKKKITDFPWLEKQMWEELREEMKVIKICYVKFSKY